MATIQVQATLSQQELLKATQQLDNAELKSLMQQLATLYAQRQVPHLSQQESELLQKINRGISEDIWRPYRALVVRRDAGQLTEEEQGELIRLSDEIEELHAERIGYLVELAQLRPVSLEDLMDALGIKPLNDA